MNSVANVIEQREDARRTLAFNQLAHNLIVEERNRRPLNALLLVLFLFGLESQLDKVLLQLFIDIVDALLTH